MAHTFKKKYKLTYKRTIEASPGIDQSIGIIQLDNGTWASQIEIENFIRLYESTRVILMDVSDTNT